MRKTLIVTSGPQKNREEFFNYDNLMQIQRANDAWVEVKFVTNNSQPLAKVYNRHYKDPANREKYIVFLHSDAIIDDPTFLEKLDFGMSEFDVAGIAGCVPPFSLQNSGGLCTWHNMGLPENRFGAVNTYRPKPVGEKYRYDDPKYRTEYGPAHRRVLMIDGVFIAINVSKCWPIVEFDEGCPSKLHFYDLMFSVLANKVGLRVGVIPVNVNHCSPGLTKVTPDFCDGNRYFGAFLNHEGLMSDRVPDKPSLGMVDCIETEDGIRSFRSGFPIPPMNGGINPPYFFIPDGGAAISVVRRVKRPVALGRQNGGPHDFVHVASDKSGCSWWRLCLVDQYGNYSQKADITPISTTIDSTSFWDRNFEAVRIQREYSDQEVAYYRMLNRMFCDRGYRTKLIWEIDDIVIGGKLPGFNMAKKFFEQPHIQDNMKRIVELCDHVTVVSDYMAKMYEPFFGGKEIRVLENYSHKGWFDGLYDLNRRMRLYEENRKRPRILIAGAGTHMLVGSTSPSDQGDYKHMMQMFVKTRKDFKWVFMGHIPAPLEPFVDNGDMEFVPWVNLVEYPVALEATNAQVLVAPLEPNDFNRAKSNIKERESYYLGRPCVCQNIEPYANAPFRFNTADEAVDHVKYILKDAQTYEGECRAFRDRAKGVWLEDVWDSKVLPAYA
jgi:hypothetical protein